MQPIGIYREAIKQVEESGPDAVRSVRLSKRQTRLLQPDVVDIEKATLHDLNDLVAKLVRGAEDKAREVDVPILLAQDLRLPSVPMLVTPIEEALAAALDICLSANDVELVRVQTSSWRSRAVVVVDRRTKTRPGQSWWREAGAMGQVALMVGVSTSQALGGRMRVLHRGDDLRTWLELPISGRPHRGSAAGQFDSPRIYTDRYSLELTGARSGLKGA
jgi:hypothetical protein